MLRFLRHPANPEKAANTGPFAAFESGLVVRTGLAGGEGGIRTPDRGVSPYNGLANRRLQPLGHLSNAFVSIA